MKSPRRRPAGRRRRVTRVAFPAYLRLVTGPHTAVDPWLAGARRALVARVHLSLEAPHPLLALATFSTLVGVALGVVVAVTTIGRLLERLL